MANMLHKNINLVAMELGGLKNMMAKMGLITCKGMGKHKTGYYK